MYEINNFEKINESLDTVILLQPTSPFRNSNHILQAIELYSDKLDMVVSVKKSHSNLFLIFLKKIMDF